MFFFFLKINSFGLCFAAFAFILNFVFASCIFMELQFTLVFSCYCHSCLFSHQIPDFAPAVF